MQPHTLPDITGDGAAHAIGAAGTRARWIAIGATGGALRVGDANVASNRGASVANGATAFLPPDPDITATYDLGNVYVYVPISSTASFTYGD